MPRLRRAVPKYRKHRGSGQSFVTLNGQEFYLGPHNSKASVAEYDRLIGEWCQDGRQLPSAHNAVATITVAEMLVAYMDYADSYYCKNGKPTSEVVDIKLSMRPLKELFGRKSVAEFGPIALKAVRQWMVDAGWARNLSQTPPTQRGSDEYQQAAAAALVSRMWMLATDLIACPSRAR